MYSPDRLNSWKELNNFDDLIVLVLKLFRQIYFVEIEIRI